ncbi:unnamed protein product [Trichobilharzia regenti]|uniref:G_PROTEIN_RECEP_F1_2 domain-containing protein n=1 Tax=Trichobilharzia regenti TaxID=157069 RepID=A0A183WHU7_TRIRE|nr:unnamed protein product [Trichobilharzia regenti]VDQ07580.1 unnamed protein product [Trichobilharzia regenti]
MINKSTDNYQVPLKSFYSSTMLYDNLSKYFLVWYLPTVITVGFAGSIFCLFFLIRSKLFPSSLQIWLISICIGDFFILMTEGIWMLLKVWFRIDLRDYNNWICILHTSFSNYLFYWSAYMQCILSIQRCYLVLCPLKVKSKFLSLSRLLVYQLLTSLFLVLPILPYPLYWQVIKGDCDPVNERIFRFTTICDLILWGFVPVFVMTTCTGIICRNLLTRHKFVHPTMHTNSKMNNNQHHHHYQHHAYRYTISSTGNLHKHSYQLPYPIHLKSVKSFGHSVNLLSSQESVFNTLDHHPIHCDVGQRKCSSHDSNMRVTPLLICMNLVYMTSVCPLVIYFLCLNFIFEKIDSDMHKFLYYLFRSFCLLNTCTNWIFYCVSGKMFRQRTKFLIMLLCRSQKKSTYTDNKGYLMTKYTSKCRCSTSNLTQNTKYSIKRPLSSKL